MSSSLYAAGALVSIPDGERACFFPRERLTSGAPVALPRRVLSRRISKAREHYKLSPEGRPMLSVSTAVAG